MLGLGLAIGAHMVNNLLPLVVTMTESLAGHAPPTKPTPPPETTLIEAWLAMSAVDLLILGPFLALMLWLLWRSGRWELRVIREELASEPEPVVMSAERDEIEREGMFQTRRIHGKNRRASAAIVNAQHELAFRKRFVTDRSGDPESDRLVAGWREEILELRRELRAS